MSLNDKSIIKTPPNDNEMQMVSLEVMKKNYNDFVEFTKGILKKGVDYGEIPGTKTPTLLKPGAEKMRMLYQLGVEVEKTDENFDYEIDFYSCTYKVSITTRTGQKVGQCEGSCNTSETKFKYRWVDCTEEYDFDDFTKMKASGEYRSQKRKNDWIQQERVENTNKIAVMNTVQKMAQKRAYVGAMSMAVGASEFFTQDLEDLGVDLGVQEGDLIQEGEIEKTPSEEKTPKQAKPKANPKQTEPKVYDSEKQLTEEDKNEIRKSDYRADGNEKPWFNEKPNFEKFKEGPKDMFKTYQEAIDEITLNYKVNRDMRSKLKALYK